MGSSMMLTDMLLATALTIFPMMILWTGLRDGVGLAMVLGLVLVNSAQAQVTLRAGPPTDCPPNLLNDGAYVPGIDAQGRPVVPAQAEGPYKLPENVTFDISVYPRDYLGGPERDAQAAVASLSAAETEAATTTAHEATDVHSGSVSSGVDPSFEQAESATAQVGEARQELLAATKAASRRRHPLGPTELGQVNVDLATGRVRIDGQEVGTKAGPCGVVPSGVAPSGAAGD